MIKIFKKEFIKFQANQTHLNFPSKTIGIDMGQSLTKIAYLGEEDKLVLYLLQTKNNFEKIYEFLKSKKEVYKIFNFSGGKSFNLFKKFSNKSETNLIKEFQANVKGVESLYLLNKNKKLPNALIVTIGTGTSIILKKETFKHLGGTALGGGLFMGLIKLIFNMNDFQEAISMAKKGNRYNIDLKVSDIYDPKDDRVDLLFRELTAASFGKVENDFDFNSVRKEDIINSIISFIGENIGTIANLMAENNLMNNIIFCGGFLKENKILRNILTILCKFNKKKAIFLRNSEFTGAIGALLG